ncbi:uncharacterized protein K452DRAFT_248761 [Aplosporella prunicola CBS 121167]|uniref:WHIM1 domain-containing protein n=1 Tax=Aplosporella prunicola CBS 121167 TaxID=1176127 RepID=A0A6A6BFV3_9PEZI|nr:uncharacterized protein K452DRAFT_248761 [Aplosporella prunicola CBS 121167]KAF2143032.1 hypothetical protein K452DRAFT_248761 [Aplosporella prunicola CBS 121167]
MSDSDLSSVLSSPPASDNESPAAVGPMDKFLKKKTTAKKKAAPAKTPDSPPPQRKRPASPPHEEVIADNPDIAFIVMFRSRFTDVFPAKCPHLGPQDVERGVVDQLPSSHIESLLCALLGLALNRKKPVEKGHYGRALEEAVAANKTQWPRSWQGVNPVSGSKSFNTMGPQERLSLLKALIIWSLSDSEAVKGMIKDSYKQSRHDDDLNQPLSVQPWGRDAEKRRYWLIEGKDDTNFRLYRESNPALKHNTWWSIAGSIDELKQVAQNLADDNVQSSRKLSERILAAIPRFEATEEKRKRREYRLARKAQFARPEPGFSLYEGRTRGKRMKYTFSDDEDELTDATSTRRSTRNSGYGTPNEVSGPTVTASGRQVRSRVGGTYGETLLSGQAGEDQSPMTADYERSGTDEPRANGRLTRSGRSGAGRAGRRRTHIDGWNSVDEMDDEDDASGGEWGGGDDDEEEEPQLDDDEEDFDEASDDDELDVMPNGGPLVVKLHVAKSRLAAMSLGTQDNKMDIDNAEENEFHTNKMDLDAPQAAPGADATVKLPSPPASESKTEPLLNGKMETAPATETATASNLGGMASQSAHTFTFNQQPVSTNHMTGAPLEDVKKVASTEQHRVALPTST